jgi:hypothetical protein
MIINTAEGQYLKEVGIDLREEYFFHICGLLKSWFCKRLTYTGTQRKETNVVYKEDLCWIFIIRMYNTCILKNS